MVELLPLQVYPFTSILFIGGILVVPGLLHFTSAPDKKE